MEIFKLFFRSTASVSKYNIELMEGKYFKSILYANLIKPILARMVNKLFYIILMRFIIPFKGSSN